MPLETRIIRQTLIPAIERETMLALHRCYFDGVHRDRFLADLAEKDWVIQLRHDDRLVGFSTQRVFSLSCDGRVRHFLFSGDTIVERAYWGEQALAGAFGHLMLSLIRQYGEEDCYWFLISKGHRTYRFLPVFFERFVPRPVTPEPPGLRRILDTVARFRFGDAFDAAAGILRTGGETDRLRPELCAPPERLRQDPYVNFFLERNPSYAGGDELACLAEIRTDNLNRFARRVIHRTNPIWV